MKTKSFNLKRILLLSILVLAFCFSMGAVIKNSKQNNQAEAASIVSYNQNNNTWSSLYYGGRTIGVTGCGILSLTNGINHYRPMAYSDVHTCVTDIASHAYSTGDFNGTYGGTMVAYFTKFAASNAAKKYKVTGGTTTYWDDAYNATLINHLKKDNTFAVANVYGHYICLADYDETMYDSYNGEYGKFLVLDSYQMVSGTAGGRVYWIGTPGGYNWASSHQLSYYNDRSYWYNLGYSSSTYHSGLKNANVVTNFHLFTIEPIETEDALTVKSNKILGDTESKKAATTWDLSKTYTPSSVAYTSRKATLSTFSGENNLYFNQSKSNHLKVGAKFKATSVADSEKFGKFGIGFYTSAGKGLFVYVDAEGTTGTSVSTITGTNVMVVGKNEGSTDGWFWKTNTNIILAEDVYNPSSPITLEVERNGVRFDVYINGTYYATVNGLNYDIDPDEEIYPCITSFNIGLEVTDYYSVATHNGLAMDGDLSDWQSLSNWDEINANKKGVYDATNSTKGATFYYRWTREGLFIYAIARHEKHVTEVNDWWQNTNFEIVINKDSAATQYYAIYNQVRGFDSFYFATTGSSGNYTTVLEGFIADCPLFAEGINLGLSFRVRNYDNDYRDYITPVGGEQTDKWWAENLDPFSFPFAVTKEYMKDQADEYEMAGKQDLSASDGQDNSYTISGISKDGTTLVLKDFGANGDPVRDFYFAEFEDSIVNSFKATFKVTGKTDSQTTSPKIGLSYLDEWGDGFYFYANTSGTTGSTASSITGTTFGLVRIEGYSYKYDEANTAVSAFNNVSWSTNQPFTLRIDRNNTTFDLYVNDVKVHTITDSTVYKLQDKQSILPSIRSWYTYAEITDYGMVLDNINGISIDADLSDWENLSNWNEISNNVVSVVDDNNSNKGYWMYSRLTDNGLLVAVKAKHAKDLSGNWGDNWWKNTCMQFYVGDSSYSNRIYVSEFLNTGFTYANFATTGTAGNYTTVFEGFIDTQTLTHLYGLSGDSIRLGLGFRINDGTTTDTLTVNGTNQTFWYADGAHPLLVNNVVTLEGSSVTPPSSENPSNPDNPPSTSNSSSSSSTSASTSVKPSSSSNSSSSVKPSSSNSVSSSVKPSSSSSSSSSVKPSSSSSVSSSVKPSSSSSSSSSVKPSSSITSSSVVVETSNETVSSSTVDTSVEESIDTSVEGTTSNEVTSEGDGKVSGGCKSSFGGAYVLMPLLAVAMIVFIKKSKKN